ncbi:MULTISPECIES: tautomerase family protein [unclassified Streptomyces]|uniref:tautomerase family protein n=1 Tax=unclassified Streptomyces TaxID=2593676 RepID=UPI000694F6EA|nr:tautomerase family protein [Streptomyces sp. NBC_00370]
MPIIRVSLLEGWTTEQKAEVARELTESLVSVLGEVSRPYIYAVVEEMQAGAVAFGGNVITHEMNLEALATSALQHQKVVNARRTEEAYDALASGNRQLIAGYWDDDVAWSVPGSHPLSGVKKGIGELLAFRVAQERLTGGTFRAERSHPLVDGTTVVVRLREAAVRENGHSLAVDALHTLEWADGRIVSGGEAFVGTAAADNDAFWS